MLIFSKKIVNKFDFQGQSVLSALQGYQEGGRISISGGRDIILTVRNDITSCRLFLYAQELH